MRTPGVGLDSKAISLQVVSGSSLQKHRNPELETPRLSRLHQHPIISNFANKKFYLMPHNLLRMGAVSIASVDISSGYSASSSEEGLVRLWQQVQSPAR